MSFLRHNVLDGDCLSSIAERYGFRDWRTIYNDPENEALRTLRPNPNLLAPGDVVMVPDARSRTEEISTAKRHTFVTPSTTCTVELRFVDPQGHPVAEAVVVLTVDGARQSTVTNADGCVRAPISRSAKLGVATVGTYSWPLAFGTLSPLIDTQELLVSFQERLNNLGYPCPKSNAEDEVTKEAIRAFQQDRGLGETATLDPLTRLALKNAHGC